MRKHSERRTKGVSTNSKHRTIVDMFVDCLGFWLRGFVHVGAFHHSDHRRAAIDEWELKGHSIETNVKSGTVTLEYEALQAPLRRNAICMPSP